MTGDRCWRLGGQRVPAARGADHGPHSAEADDHHRPGGRFRNRGADHAHRGHDVGLVVEGVGDVAVFPLALLVLAALLADDRALLGDEVGLQGVAHQEASNVERVGVEAVGEGVVVGFEEFMITEDSGKYTSETGMSKSSSALEFKIPGNMLGSLVVRTPEGVEFNIGTGFDFDTRKQLWEERGTLAGKIVRWKSMLHGELNKPRHPVFLGIRDPIDLD